MELMGRVSRRIYAGRCRDSSSRFFVVALDNDDKIQLVAHPVLFRYAGTHTVRIPPS